MKVCDRCRVSGCLLNYGGKACREARKRECPDVVFTRKEARTLAVAYGEGRVLILPCKIGSKVYGLFASCDFPGTCGAERTCTGCEHLEVFIKEFPFCISMLNQNGRLEPPYFLTREEAEKALEAEHGNK